MNLACIRLYSFSAILFNDFSFIVHVGILIDPLAVPFDIVSLLRGLSRIISRACSKGQTCSSSPTRLEKSLIKSLSTSQKKSFPSSVQNRWTQELLVESSMTRLSNKIFQVIAFTC